MSFRFKQFTIHQDRTAMKVGTDGVLLGAWAQVDGAESRVLDIGTGTGLIAIMMAQRAAQAEIIGVEIDKESAEQAAQNMAESKWHGRLNVAHLPIQEYAPPHKFDLILSNPPYFVDSLKSKGESRTVARHTTALSFEDLVTAVQRLLCDHGRFAVILPTTEAQVFDRAAEGMLYLLRRCRVKGKEGGVVRRVMSEYSLRPTPEPAESELSVRGTPPEVYTAEYRELTSEFYL